MIWLSDTGEQWWGWGCSCWCVVLLSWPCSAHRAPPRGCNLGATGSIHMPGVKLVGDLETFDPMKFPAGGKGGWPRQGSPQGTSPGWEMGLLLCEETPAMAKQGWATCRLCHRSVQRCSSQSREQQQTKNKPHCSELSQRGRKLHSWQWQRS